MKICVIHPKIAKESATRLAKALKAGVSNPYREDRNEYRGYDLVFNYGVSCHIQYNKNIINSPASVAICKDKWATFQSLKQAGVPVTEFTHSKQLVPNSWKSVVCRKTVDGARGEGITFIEKGEPIPDAALYTEYYKHQWEFRIVVFLGKVVGRFLKMEVDDEWELVELEPDGCEEMDAACIKAAKVLGINYVGFDVLAKTMDKFVILEANSAPIITDSIIKNIKKYFKE